MGAGATADAVPRRLLAPALGFPAPCQATLRQRSAPCLVHHALPFPDADEEPGVLVRSGAFEVCLRSRQLRPCYWPAARHRVLRGTWFAEKGGEWMPLKVGACRAGDQAGDFCASLMEDAAALTARRLRCAPVSALQNILPPRNCCTRPNCRRSRWQSSWRRVISRPSGCPGAGACSRSRAAARPRAWS